MSPTQKNKFADAAYGVNRRAQFDYEILDEYEAGVELLGFEVKAIKAGRMSLIGAFAIVKENQVWLLNAVISPYQQNNTPKNYDPARTRRLLLHRAQINELLGKSGRAGLTIVPLKVYTKNRRIKLRIGLARHKKQHDQRESIKKRDAGREIDRTLKGG